MKLVIQRVNTASLSVDGKEISKINRGLVVFVGIGKEEKEEKFLTYAKKLVNLRIFEDENGKMNLSLLDIKGEMLIVSQFTLFADTSHGNRPSFFDAEKPEKAKQLFDEFVTKVKEYALVIKTGVFGADMKINQENDGPVTIII